MNCAARINKKLGKVCLLCGHPPTSKQEKCEQPEKTNECISKSHIIFDLTFNFVRAACVAELFFMKFYNLFINENIIMLSTTTLMDEEHIIFFAARFYLAFPPRGIKSNLEAFCLLTYLCRDNRKVLINISAPGAPTGKTF